MTRSIAVQFHVGISALQWVVDAYNLAYACLLLTGGMGLVSTGLLMLGFGRGRFAAVVCGLRRAVDRRRAGDVRWTGDGGDGC